tara:strand:+ start:588 stop:941 length:354 start_codon:yes stop_codon:yes gene_type:complete
MQILSTTGGTVNFIPRQSIDNTKTYSVKVISENQNKTIFTDNTASIGSIKYYSNYALSTTLIDGEFYNLEISNSTDNIVVAKDKIFCTNQVIDSYKITDGVFTQHNTGADEFIFYTS